MGELIDLQALERRLRRRAEGRLGRDLAEVAVAAAAAMNVLRLAPPDHGRQLAYDLLLERLAKLDRRLDELDREHRRRGVQTLAS